MESTIIDWGSEPLRCRVVFPERKNDSRFNYQIVQDISLTKIKWSVIEENGEIVYIFRSFKDFLLALWSTRKNLCSPMMPKIKIDYLILNGPKKWIFPRNEIKIIATKIWLESNTPDLEIWTNLPVFSFNSCENFLARYEVRVLSPECIFQLDWWVLNMLTNLSQGKQQDKEELNVLASLWILDLVPEQSKDLVQRCLVRNGIMKQQ